VGLVDYADTIFEACDGDEMMGPRKLNFEQFMQVILDLRGSKNARVKDVVELRKHINYRFQRLENRLMDMDCLARYHGANAGLQEAAKSSRGVQESAWASDIRANGSQSPSQSNVSGMTSVAIVQNVVVDSLRDLQAAHERELAILHAEQIRLLDKLKDLGKAAGKSLKDVLEVASKVPRTNDSITLAGSTPVVAMATAERQPAASPCTHVQMPSRDFSSFSGSSMEKLPSACAANATPYRFTKTSLPQASVIGP
jgi:hypothetical protein